MQQAPRSAGSFFASLGGALGLSLLAHAAGLAGLFWAMQPMSAPAMSRQKGAIVVTLASPAPHRSSTTKATAIASPEPRPSTAKPSPATPLQPYMGKAQMANLDKSPTAPAPLAPTAAPQPDPPPDEPSPPSPASPDASTARPSVAATAAADPAEGPTATTPTARPGTRFTSLFAPVIARPMGRGRWGTSPHHSPSPEALAQQAQAQAAVRQALADRVVQLQPMLVRAPLQGRCDVRIDVTQRHAQMRCTEPADEARLWAVLDQIVTPGPVSMASAPSCLEADTDRIRWCECPASADTPPA